MRSTCTRIVPRTPSTGSGAATSSPLPWSRTIRGGPSNAQNITQMRPLSRRCATVSAPLPTWSSYSIVCSSTIRNEPIGPFGETLTRPPWAGAVATKNRRCRPIQPASFASAGGGRQLSAHLDACLLALIVGVCGWTLFASQAMTEGSIAARAISVAYPICDLVLLALLARSVFVRGDRARSYWLLLAAVVLLFLSDGAFVMPLL